MSYKLPRPGKSRREKRSGATQKDTIRIMKKVAYESAKNPYWQYLIKKYDLKNDLKSMKKIFDFSFFNTYFKGDNQKTQTIRTGTRSINDKRANCVDYSILISSFLINLRVPHSFRMISTEKNDPNNLSHIFIVTPYGTIDPVIGQDQDGNEQYKKREQRTPNFLMQAPFYKKVDLKVL